MALRALAVASVFISACNGVELVSIADTPTMRGITIPLPPPALIDEPVVHVDIEGILPEGAGSPGTQVLLYERVSDRGYFVYSDERDYIFYDVLVDVTNNCLWTNFIEGGDPGEVSAKAYYKLVLQDADEDPQACDAEECSGLDEQNMCVCLVQWNTGC